MLKLPLPASGRMNPGELGGPASTIERLGLVPGRNKSFGMVLAIVQASPDSRNIVESLSWVLMGP